MPEQNTATTRPPAGFNPGQYGEAAYLPGEGVEVLGDNGWRHCVGRVSQSQLTPLGWRYEVQTLRAQSGLNALCCRFVVSDWNLRALKDETQLKLLMAGAL